MHLIVLCIWSGNTGALFDRSAMMERQSTGRDGWSSNTDVSFGMTARAERQVFGGDSRSSTDPNIFRLSSDDIIY
jgi:hypothetical protein